MQLEISDIDLDCLHVCSLVLVDFLSWVFHSEWFRRESPAMTRSWTLMPDTTVKLSMSSDSVVKTKSSVLLHLVGLSVIWVR